MRKLTIEEIKQTLNKPYIQEVLNGIANKTHKLMDLKVRIIGYTTGLYGEITTFTREDLITAYKQKEV